jgi:hypothetical protein
LRVGFAELWEACDRARCDAEIWASVNPRLARDAEAFETMQRVLSWLEQDPLALKLLKERYPAWKAMVWGDARK